MTKTLFILTSILSLGLAPSFASAMFNSGSTGLDGAFNPTADIEVPLPANGIFNFTSVNIPAGVTVRFRKNANNTPVTILATGNVTIAGTIDISGGASQNVGTNTVLDYTVPGSGGAGGFDGGRGGLSQLNSIAGNGLGPGGGGGGNRVTACCNAWAQGGGGGGYNVAGANNFWGAPNSNNTGGGGSAYGSNLLVPLLGGSGGGGGAGGTVFPGSGGGGGGGAILIAASGTVTITGSINAKGGAAGNSATSSVPSGGGCGGGGSGGAIRIVANAISGSGTLDVAGGASTCSNIQLTGGAGSAGYISRETVTAGSINVSNFPTLRIASVGGVSAPASPTGQGDVTLAANTPNPVTVVLNTTGVPTGNTVRLTVTPSRGAATSVTSSTLTGTTASASVSVNIDIPSGSSTLFATTTYVLTAALGDEYSRFAHGERVEKIELSASLHGPSLVTLITVSGKRYTLPSSVVALG